MGLSEPSTPIRPGDPRSGAPETRRCSMKIRTSIAAAGAVVVLGGTGSVLLPAVASANSTATPQGSIVYLKNGNVWIAHADGTQARQFTTHTYNWSSPTEADNGTVVVA